MDTPQRQENGPPNVTLAPRERRTMTVEEAGRVLGIGRATAYAAAKRGEIPTISIGRRLLVPTEAIERMLAGAAPAGDAA